MNSNRMLIVYAILSLSLVGSAVVLAKQVRHFMNEREDLTVQFHNRVINEEEIKVQIQGKEEANKQDVLLTFSQTKSFQPLATPVPMPTATPIPPPEPTPVVAARGWMIDFAIKNFAIIVDPGKNSVSVRIGDEIPNTGYGEPFSIIDINPSSDRPSVKVKETKSGVVGEINQEIPRAAAGK